ncbi:MAG TPA: di-heme oxidoredictase family protein [Candidatus Angelobacter sp.]|nr:di-heme oxidoredictase family protein [Candidatus Angelobacter sp.]
MRLRKFLLPLAVALGVLLLAQTTSQIPGADLSPAGSLTNAPAAFASPLGNGAQFMANGSNNSQICPEIGNLAFDPDVAGQPANDSLTNCKDNGVEPSLNDFIDDKSIFETQETILDGLGPIYNDKSCVNCHQNPVAGGSTHITELRVGQTVNGVFQNPVALNDYGQETIPDPQGQNQPRSLINALTICPDAAEVTPDSLSTRVNPNAKRALRQSLNLLGDGFVESIADSTLIKNGQDTCNLTQGKICGEAIMVDVLECNDPKIPTTCNSTGQAVGRFGWKDQFSSLLSFSSDAYLNEIGITNRLPPNRKDVTHVCDTQPDPEDKFNSTTQMADIDHFARFMRALQAPPPEDQEDIAETGTAGNISHGSGIFVTVGCQLCHTQQFATAPPGTLVNAGAFKVPPALGSKIIAPFSDFLLHNINTGDGIVQNGPQDTAMKIRTAPLWGLHTRNRFLHDGSALTITEAILAHGNEASNVIINFNNLSDADRKDLLIFLNSL